MHATILIAKHQLRIIDSFLNYRVNMDFPWAQAVQIVYSPYIIDTQSLISNVCINYLQLEIAKCCDKIIKSTSREIWRSWIGPTIWIQFVYLNKGVSQMVMSVFSFQCDAKNQWIWLLQSSKRTHSASNQRQPDSLGNSLFSLTLAVKRSVC